MERNVWVEIHFNQSFNLFVLYSLKWNWREIADLLPMHFNESFYFHLLYEKNNLFKFSKKWKKKLKPLENEKFYKDTIKFKFKWVKLIREL